MWLPYFTFPLPLTFFFLFFAHRDVKLKFLTVTIQFLTIFNYFNWFSDTLSNDTLYALNYQSTFHLSHVTFYVIFIANLPRFPSTSWICRNLANMSPTVLKFMLLWSPSIKLLCASICLYQLRFECSQIHKFSTVRNFLSRNLLKLKLIN
jgi:hypothetical protein